MHPFLVLLAELIRDPAERHYFCAQGFYAIRNKCFYGEGGVRLVRNSATDAYPLLKLLDTVAQDFTTRNFNIREVTDRGIGPYRGVGVNRPEGFDVERFVGTGQEFFSNPRNLEATKLTYHTPDNWAAQQANAIAQTLALPPVTISDELDTLEAAIQVLRGEIETSFNAFTATLLERLRK